jgi:catecholate siderophore receptor
VASTYVQDQMSLSDRVSITAGLRYEQFRIRYHNNRNGAELSRRDALLSPRAGIVIKPATPVSIYGSYSMSYLPSSGDQFTTLTVTTQTLKPEQFINREIGVKWELRPGLVMHSALYRLDRTNTSAPDPLDATRTVQTGAQRTSGAEVGVTGDVTDVWQVAAGYTMQRARIVSTTAAGRIGASVPLVPHSTVSLWNRVNARPDLGVGLGVVHQTRMFAAIDNTVQLPGFTRVDGALFLPVVRGLRLQMNIENLLNTRYFATSHGNNNIMPGATRTVRLSVGIGQ